MPFAVFYNRQDLTPIAAELTRSSLQGADKQLAQKLWNGGVKNWDTAPFTMGTVDEAYACNDPDCRTLVIDAAGVTLADMTGLMRRIAASTPGAEYLIALARDMDNGGGAKDPYP